MRSKLENEAKRNMLGSSRQASACRETSDLCKTDVLRRLGAREDQGPPLPILREFLTISQSVGFAPDGSLPEKHQFI